MKKSPLALGFPLLHSARPGGASVHARRDRTPSSSIALDSNVIMSLRSIGKSLSVWTGLGVLVLASACGSGGGGSSANVVGAEVEKPDGSGTFFVDPNRGGGATRLHLTQMFWARLVDVHDIDAQGNPSLEPVFRDFTVNENVQSDGTNYLLETNPITQKARLTILRQRGEPDVGLGTFESLLRSAAQGLPAVIPKNDDGSSGEPFSFVARNSTLVLQFDDLLDDDSESERNLIETVRVKTGYPPVTPFPARQIFDPNHGDVVGGEFHSTRILIDLTVSETEAAGLEVPQPVNAVGLPASLPTQTGPNVSIRIPTQVAFGSGQFQVLRGLSGVALAPFENGPLDSDSPTRDIVRAMRAGGPEDQNNGFLLDLSAPEVVGGWSLRIDRALADPDGQTGMDFLVDLTFNTICRAAPTDGDVLAIGDVFLEVVGDGPPPDTDGQVLNLSVRNLAEDPLAPGTPLVGNGLFLSTYQPADPVPAGCWVNFAPQPNVLPANGVATNAVVLVRFSEAMDPSTMSPFDNFFLVRGDSNTVINPTNLIVGTIDVSTDLKDFTFNPLLELPHAAATDETYHVQITGVTDLAGNVLRNPLPPVNFVMDEDAEPVSSGGTVLRFGSVDELEPIGFPDLRGQFFFDLTREVIRPRPVAFASYPADRTNPVPSIMIPFARGVQTPLSPLGSKLMTMWRYCDLGWQILDESKYNLDVYGLSWAPVGGQIINDFYELFEIRLSHSRRQPDEAIDAFLLPKWPNSGLGGPRFTDNILQDPLSPQKIVHERNLQYRLSSVDLFAAPTGTIMLPFPLNRNDALAPVTYLWRDTAVVAKGGPGGAGIPLDIEQGNPLNLEDEFGYVAPKDQVPSFGLPLLIEFRCFPSNTGIGLNALDLSLAINSSAIPSFRVFSTGGINTSRETVTVNPDEADQPRGGYNPSSTPPGQRTNRSDDNGFYVGQLDTVTRVSRVHTVWIDTSLPSPDYFDPVVLPDSGEQPAGTQVVIEYRGATDFTFSDFDPAEDEQLYKFDSRHIDPYGEIFAIDDEGFFQLLGTDAFAGEVAYSTGNAAWVADIDSIDGAQYLQMRVTFVNNILTGLNPELSAIAIPYAE